MPVLLASAYLPPLRYVAEAAKADEIVIEIFETYTKQTCRNHCTIYGPNGKQTLTIPVIRVNGNHTLTKDIRISAHQPWQKIHWRSVETAYNNSPFFLYYQDYFLPFYEKRFSFLVDFNTALLEKVLQILNSEGHIRLSDSFEKSPDELSDRRNDLVAKHDTCPVAYPHYTQVFEPRHGFIPGLSVLDVIFNLGPEACSYLQRLI
jgi:hypothetical protein